MKFSEDMLIGYTKPLSETEDQKCLNAINMVRDALMQQGYTNDFATPRRVSEDTSSYLYKLRRGGESSREITIFVQGSYANGTNVKAESDVDIAAVLESSFRDEYRAGITRGNYGFTNSADSVYLFKNDVVESLKRKFGNDVERRDKSVFVLGNSYRVDIDAVPSMRYRDYRNDFYINPDNFIGGIVICPDSGGQIINFPEQHIINGKTKNVATALYYKKIVRIYKKIRYIMQDAKIGNADSVSSFGIESLLYNVPNELLSNQSTYCQKVMSVLAHLYRNSTQLSSYVEANGIKKLCPGADEVAKYTSFITSILAFFDI